jgi:hypothetical protein
VRDDREIYESLRKINAKEEFMNNLFEEVMEYKKYLVHNLELYF